MHADPGPASRGAWGGLAPPTTFWSPPCNDPQTRLSELGYTKNYQTLKYVEIMFEIKEPIIV